MGKKRKWRGHPTAMPWAARAPLPWESHTGARLVEPTAWAPSAADTKWRVFLWRPQDLGAGWGQGTASSECGQTLARAVVIENCSLGVLSETRWGSLAALSSPCTEWQDTCVTWRWQSHCLCVLTSSSIHAFLSNDRNTEKCPGSLSNVDFFSLSSSFFLLFRFDVLHKQVIHSS